MAKHTRLVVPLYLFVNLALLTLKLAHRWPVATWSWWGVTGPLWGPWVLAALGWGLHLRAQRRRR